MEAQCIDLDSRFSLSFYRMSQVIRWMCFKQDGSAFSLTLYLCAYGKFSQLNVLLNPFNTEPLAIFLLLKNDNLGMIH